ncbi:MAG: hypothetical protein ABI605_19205 [Rhizobacter sp.]
MKVNQPGWRTPFQIAVLAWSIAAACPAHASPADPVFVPYDDEGDRFVQYAFGHEKARDGSSEQAHSLALGWNPTARWFTSLYAGWYREPGESTSLYAYSWVNHVNLVKQGGSGSPVEVGIYLEIERPRERDEGYELTGGPTFQFDAGSFQINANLWLRKSVHTEDAAPAALLYQWQAKRLWMQHVELGAQGMGNVGPWHQWRSGSEQEHAIGPAIFFKLAVNNSHSLNVDAAVLAGLTSASPRATFRVRSQYEF